MISRIRIEAGGPDMQECLEHLTKARVAVEAVAPYLICDQELYELVTDKDEHKPLGWTGRLVLVRRDNAATAGVPVTMATNTSFAA